MKATNGSLLTKILSGQSLRNSLTAIPEIILLTGAGMLAIFLHARLNSPLHTPGHHGIEFMAIFISGRILSKLPFASSLSGLGAGLLPLFPAFGFADPFMGFNYMLPGIVLDVAFMLFPAFRKDFVFYVLMAGLGYMSIPLSRFLIMITLHYPYGALHKYGVAMTAASFFSFGSPQTQRVLRNLFVCRDIPTNKKTAPRQSH